ncbi:Crp/Fnr family transcriptional regulator [Brevibacillus sp. H7]|jgi:CRP-like cAMP-binding protein|uniref:Crp/Fnr family transcriptional regulator n=1 Tax=Brevibacillus sp. H7 TaxID=3349138 RepID=UPI0037F1C8CD
MITNLDYKDQTMDELWQPFMKHGERLFMKRNSIIYSQGKTGSGFYYLHKGLIKIVSIKPDGSNKILDVHGPGKLFGEQAVDQKPYFSTAIASDDSILYYFTNQRFKELIFSSPTFLNLFVDSIIQKMRILTEEIMLNVFTAEQHIAFTLLKVRQVCKNDRISLTQQELANYTGLTRITVYKILKKWRNEQVIDIQNRMIHIKQPDVLLRYTGDHLL